MEASYSQLCVWWSKVKVIEMLQSETNAIFTIYGTPFHVKKGTRRIKLKTKTNMWLTTLNQSKHKKEKKNYGKEEKTLFRSIFSSLNFITLIHSRIFLLLSLRFVRQFSFFFLTKLTTKCPR